MATFEFDWGRPTCRDDAGLEDKSSNRRPPILGGLLREFAQDLLAPDEFLRYIAFQR